MASYAENVSIWWRHHVIREDEIWDVEYKALEENWPRYNDTALYVHIRLEVHPGT